jgi:hypothetical protein
MTVRVFYKNALIDNPGPWGDMDGAMAWAEAIVARWAIEGHIPS